MTIMKCRVTIVAAGILGHKDHKEHKGFVNFVFSVAHNI